ncbi:hypothetical protein BS47DRAFT_1288712 [Hydnum rufescens UP504]|uniref:Uncharacterized protein n=1 Tax=Hydnum rufescens UP504 TaxID=1448309 RepID=A0A9P6DZ63_9AGAM|nr:hypothetical protein BS47DRAFT_1288712 [Hydnum rufescens UP504]
MPRLVNPFDTHKFFQSLEREFSPPVAHTLMRATRGLLIHRIAEAKRDGLDVMEAENQQYLYRAALSELRTELSMRTKNESAALQTSTSTIRKDVESLSARMKEELATLKHNVQMDMNNRKNEVNSETKKSAIAIEELHHKATVMISDLRTDVEQAKWDNTRRGVAIIGLFVMFVIASLELAPKPASKPKPRKATSPPPPTSELSLSPPPNGSSSSTTQAGSHGRVTAGESSRAGSHLHEFSESSQV